MRRDELLPPGLGAPAESDLAKVYGRFRQAFVRGLGRFRGAGVSAEDALHDAVVRYIAASPPLENEDQARAYLHQVVRNRAAHELREQRAGRSLQTVALDEETTQMAIDPGAGPLDAAHQRQRMERLGQALEELPERQREAFVLHRFDGLTQDEVAERMGVSRRMVVKHLARALAYCEARVQYASAEQMRALLGHPAAVAEEGER